MGIDISLNTASEYLFEIFILYGRFFLLHFESDFLDFRFKLTVHSL